jgi:hypothetical protein
MAQHSPRRANSGKLAGCAHDSGHEWVDCRRLPEAFLRKALHRRVSQITYGKPAGCRLETMSSLTLLASAKSQSCLPPSQLVSSTTAVLTLSTLRGTRGLLVAGRPLGVLL